MVMSSKYIAYGVLVIVVGVLILFSLPYVHHNLGVGLGTLNKEKFTREISLYPLQTVSIKFNLTKGDAVNINVKLSSENTRVLLNLKNPSGNYIIKANNVPDGYEYRFEASETGTYEMSLTNVLNLFSPINVSLTAFVYPYGSLTRNIIDPIFSLIGFSMLIIGLIVILIAFILSKR